MTGDAAFNSNIAPSYAVNESCSLLKDEAQIVTWEEDDWEYVGIVFAWYIEFFRGSIAYANLHETLSTSMQIACKTF